MFRIDKELSFEQFKPFKKEGGILPSFLVEYSNSIDLEYIKKLIPARTLGDYTFYNTNNDGRIVISFNGLFLIMDPIAQSGRVYIDNYTRNSFEHDLSYLLMQGYMYRLVMCGNLMIHSATIIYKDCGVLFCGKSGAGKSTQANLWKKYFKTEVLNYDKPCIINNNHHYYVHGSPWSGKEGVYKNKYVDIRAIVFVNQSKNNHVELLSPTKAYANLYLNNYVYPINDRVESKYSDVIKEIAEKIPVYDLYCDISEDAVKTLFKELFPYTNYLKAKEDYIMAYRIKKNFVMKQVADEYIVTRRGAEAIDFGAVVVFNETGAFLWEQMHDYISVDELSKKLAQKYTLDFETAKKDCTDFIEKMIENGFLDSEE